MSRKKQNISYVKPEEPAFLKRIKEQVGYKEGPTVGTKREMPTFDDDGEEDVEREDDKPQVVVLKAGDVDEEELAEIIHKKTEDEDRKKIEEGKITFKKPLKRASSIGDEEAANVSTTKKLKASEISEKPKVNVKAVHENRLLSFETPADEDDDT